MAQRMIRLYSSEFPDTWPFAAFFRLPDVKTVFLRDQQFFELKNPDLNCIFLIHEAVFTANLLKFLHYFDKADKNLPLLVVGDRFNQSYLEHLFANRPFTYVEMPVSEKQLYDLCLKVRAGQARSLPAHDYEKELQTAKEKGIKLSVLKNWKGFNFPDSPSLSAYAMALKHGKPLEDREWADLQKRMVKYDKQLAKLEIFWK